MKKIVVNDANIFIDLQNVGLLEMFFLLPWEVHTTDFIMFELLKGGQKDTIATYESNGHLSIATFEFSNVQTFWKNYAIYSKNRHLLNI